MPSESEFEVIGSEKRSASVEGAVREFLRAREIVEKPRSGLISRANCGILSEASREVVVQRDLNRGGVEVDLVIIEKVCVRDGEFFREGKAFKRRLIVRAYSLEREEGARNETKRTSAVVSLNCDNVRHG